MNTFKPGMSGLHASATSLILNHHCLALESIFLRSPVVVSEFLSSTDYKQPKLAVNTVAGLLE